VEHDAGPGQGVRMASPASRFENRCFSGQARTKVKAVVWQKALERKEQPKVGPLGQKPFGVF